MTGSRRTALSCITRSASAVSSPASTATRSGLHTAPTGEPGGADSASARTTMSRSVTSPQSLSPSTTRTEPTALSRMARAASAMD